VGCEVTLALHSKDYIYTLALPEFGIKEIAVPDLRFELKFVADRIGTFQLKGDQMCGYQHENLIGKLVIQPRPQFMAWLAEKGAKDDAEDLQDLGLLRADRPDEPLLVR
jgi:cytochrome c oxidase subunit 2